MVESSRFAAEVNAQRRSAYRWVWATQAPPAGYKAGDRTMGGTLRATGRGYGTPRAIDPVTGERKWELRHPTPSWAGVLATSGSVVFSGDRKATSLPLIRARARSCGGIRSVLRFTPRRQRTRSALASTYVVVPGRNDAHGVRSPSTLSLHITHDA